MATSLHQEIHGITDKHEHARDFLFQRGILKSSMSWPRCSAPMTLTACSTSKSPDLLIWRCSPCIMLIYYLSIKSLTSIAVAQLTDLSENTISEWKILLHVQVSNWLMANPSLLGGPGVIVELDEAKFGKRKFNKGSYREGQWVLGAVDRNTGHCFLLPCPNNRRDAPTLLPLISRWILPGSVVHTDEWAAYNGR